MNQNSSPREARQGMARVMAATALYGIFHSAVASLAAKRGAAAVFGSRNRNGLYRPFYILQSFVTFGLFARYAWNQPHRQLWQLHGPAAMVMHLGQLAAFAYATWAARQVGVRRITGLANFWRWIRGQDVEQEPEAQGPALDEEGLSNPIGPFALSRHPLNFVPVVIFWLWPRMNTNLLAYNIVMTAYLVLGSVHEEARLRAAYGAHYERYVARSTSFYVPVPGAWTSERTGTFTSEGIQED